MKWILARAPGPDQETIQLLESRHAKALMMNAPIIIISDLTGDAIVSMRKELGSRMKILSDEGGKVISSMVQEIGDFSLMVLDRDHRAVSIYRGLDIQILDRALRKASRV